MFTGTEFDRSRPRLTLPPDLTAVPIVNLHMYNVFAAEGVNEKPRSGITAWPKFAARDRSVSLCFVWAVARLVGANGSVRARVKWLAYFDSTVTWLFAKLHNVYSNS